MSAGSPTLAGVRAALDRIRPYFGETPLVRCEALSRAMNADVWLKNETNTPIASFKLRGALNAVAQIKRQGEVMRVTTSSTGNHGQGVAYAGRLLGLSSDIFMPQPINPMKAAMVRQFGGVVHAVDADYEQAKAAAKRFSADNGGAFIDDGEDIDVMEGAGTLALEVARALPNIDAMVVPMGGGNLAAGCAIALKGEQPDAKIYSVQSEASPAVTESFRAGTAVALPARTLAEGLVTSMPAQLALSILLKRLDEAWLVSDEELYAAVHTLAECAHVLVELAGAAAFAGIWKQRHRFIGRRLVLVLTGGNVTMADLRHALAVAPTVSLAEAFR